jgi:hypothetical protein
VQDDAQGKFMVCGKCAKRVALEKVSQPGVESWRVVAPHR